MNIEHWLSPVVMRPLGWVLLHFVWQGTALAALAAAAMAMCRRPAVRYALGVAALVLMVAVPVATFVFYWQSDSVPTATAAPDAAQAYVYAARALPAAPGLTATSHRAAPDIFPRLVEAWLVGVIFFSLRCAGGVLLLERMRRRQALAINPTLLEICQDLQRRLRLTRAIRYCECRWLEAPAVIGWFRPIVLLPVTALTGLSEDQLQAVIAHELAHIKRLDAFVNAFQIAAETVLFYHPAVWWLNQRIRAERENSCDDVAIALCGNAVEYARALTLMEEWRSAPALAMAANRGPLTVRISRLLNLSPSRPGVRGLGLTTTLLCLAAAIVAVGAVLGMARPDSAFQSVTAPSAPSAASPAVRPTKQAKTSPSAKASPATNATPATAPSEADEPVSTSSYIDAMKAVGLTNLTADQLVAMKIQDVTPDYVRGIQEQGFHPSVDSLIGMKIQGVTPDYIRSLRAAGLSLDEDQLIALKIQGADGAYLRALQEAGLHPDTDQLIAMKVQGVTPALVSELRVVGLAPDADQVIALKVQGVDPRYVQNLYELKLQPSVDDIVAMKIQGVTPDYVREIRSLGLNPTVDEVVSMRVQQITPAYIKALQAAGFKFDVDELISAKVQGITPEFAEQARKHGFQNLTLDKLIELKRVGVFETPTDI